MSLRLGIGRRKEVGGIGGRKSGGGEPDLGQARPSLAAHFLPAGFFAVPLAAGLAGALVAVPLDCFAVALLVFFSAAMTCPFVEEVRTLPINAPTGRGWWMSRGHRGPRGYRPSAGPAR